MAFIEFGALLFGMVVGWQVYFANRYRARVAITDLTVIVGVLGGGAILTLFPEQSRLFAAYGIGLAVGFFGYFALLVAIVLRSGRGKYRGEGTAAGRWTMEWFLDGRRPGLEEWQVESTGSRAMGPGSGPPVR